MSEVQPAPRDPAAWIDIFRTIGTMASVVALDLAGTPEGAVELRRGAGGDMTIELDSRLEEIVIRELSRYNGVRLVSEECGTKDFGRPRIGVIADPLDGSFNAKNGIPLYAISLAMTALPSTLGNVRAGYVRNLVTGDEYWAIRNRGAYHGRGRLKVRQSTRLGVAALELHTARDVKAADYRRSLAVLREVSRGRSYGSIALELCFLARGAIDAVVDANGKQCRPLDVAAGALIVEEAGGRVTDASGRSLSRIPINLKTRIDFLATSTATLQRKVVRLLDGAAKTR